MPDSPSTDRDIYKVVALLFAAHALPVDSTASKDKPCPQAVIGLCNIASSMIEVLVYAPASQELDVTFTSGSVYRYSDVALMDAVHLLIAAISGQSVGTVFNDRIKNARKPYTKLS